MSENTTPPHLIYHKWVVLCMLFGVLGALGIPLLIKSPCFTRLEKWFWSIVIVLYTLLLLLAAYFTVHLAISRIREAEELFWQSY